ncbi:MAG TPA: hypothetical protein VMS89_01470 [Methanoregulaceae archaeon]|nr:hypothetical protein [Methanoregulaceae archaeon]
MSSQYNLSDDLNNLIAHVETVLGTGIVLRRQDNVPEQGVLIDDYTFGSGKNLIIFSSGDLGMLKDYSIAKNCLILLYKGVAVQKGTYQVLSFDRATAVSGMKQIYLDILKDENTRVLAISEKKKMICSLYQLFRNTVSEIPWSILANINISKQFPAMRNSQVYLLLKESMKEMHRLENENRCLPQRYYVMNNGMYYARDILLSYSMAEYRLNPVINIPELQKFRALDMKEMMDSRWSRSHWYHTKIVGDAMANILKLTLTADFRGPTDTGLYYEISESGKNVINRWLVMMAMQDWYRWDTPGHLRGALQEQSEIEKYAIGEIFSA